MPTTQQQQHGISRSRFHARPIRLAGRPDPEALLSDIHALRETIGGLETELTDTVDGLVERINQMILSGALDERPAPGVADRIYLVVVNHTPGPLYFDDGSQWVLVGSPTQEGARAVLLDGAFAHTFAVEQESATYAPAISTTWWTMVKIASQTATALVLEFSNPASAGDVVTVSIP